MGHRADNRQEGKRSWLSIRPRPVKKSRERGGRGSITGRSGHRDQSHVGVRGKLSKQNTGGRTPKGIAQGKETAKKNRGGLVKFYSCAVKEGGEKVFQKGRRAERAASRGDDGQGGRIVGKKKRGIVRQG